MRQHLISKAVLGASLAAALMVMPASAQAQAPRRTPSHGGGGGGHVSGGVGVRGPVVVSRGVYGRSYYYRPYYYRPYYYDPFFWGSYGWGWGWGVGLGYGYGWGWSPYGYGYPYSPYYGYYGRYSDARIEVKPKDAKVYVDGYYAGVVDDFDGWAQRLDVPPGQHEIEIYAPGYRTRKEQVLFRPGNTVKIKGELEKLPAGAPPEPEPQPVAPPPGQQQRYQGQPPYQGPPPDDTNAGADQQQPPPPPQQPYAGRPSRRAPQYSARVTDPSQFGTLSIRVQPRDAEIRVDGEKWETSDGQPGFSIQLAPGRHRVEVKKDGFRTFSADIEVQPGELTPLNVSLLGAHEIE